MNFAFRDASASDLEGLAAISGTGWTRRQFEDELGKGLFVADAAAGFAALRIVAGEARLYMIGVAAGSRRRGVARALLEECFRRARLAGCRVMTLEVGENNAAARALYDSCGFRVVGRRAKYYNDGADALLMDAPL